VILFRSRAGYQSWNWRRCNFVVPALIAGVLSGALLCAEALQAQPPAAERNQLRASKQDEPVQLLAAATENIITPAIRDVGVYEDLYARTLVLSDGTTTVALVALDLGGLSPVASADRLRTIVHRASGIPVDHIGLICSHTHNARSPDDDTWLQDKQPSSAELKVEDDWFADLDIPSPFTRWMYGQIAESVRRARQNLRPAVLRTGRAEVQVGHNRRLARSDGSITMRPNLHGAVVPWVDVLDVATRQSDKGATQESEKGSSPGYDGLLFSHPAHPVIVHATSDKIGPDFPGFAVNHLRRLQAASGRARAVTMFAQGCAGNINGYPLKGGLAAADTAGLSLALAASRATKDLQQVRPAKIRIATRRLALPLTVPSVAQAKKWVEHRPNNKYYREMLEVAESGESRTMPFPISVIGIGEDLCFLLLPHDIFAEYQLFADKASQARQTFVFGYTNGTGSYVGTKRDYLLGERGGYETSPLGQPSTSSYRFPPQPAAEALIHAAISELLDQVQPRE